MKKGLLVAFTLLLSINTYSNEIAFSGGRQLLPSGMIGGTLGTEAGDYNINTYNRSELQIKYLDILEKRQNKDKDLLLSTIDKAEREFQHFLKYDLIQGLQKVSDDSLTSESDRIKPKPMYAAVRSYNLGLTNLKNSIKNISLLSKSLKGTNISSKIDGHEDSLDLPQNLNFDLSTISDFYLKQLKEKVEQSVDNLEFAIDLRDYHKGYKVLKFSNLYELKKMRLYTKSYYDEQMTIAQSLESEVSLFERKVDQSYNLFIREMMKTHINSYGIKQKRRDILDKSGLKDSLESLTKAFWTRSFLRVAFGIELKSFEIRWDTKMLNLDYFNKTGLVIQKNMIDTTEGDYGLKEQRRKLVNALYAMEKRTETKEFFTLESSLMSKVSTALTFLAGNQDQAKANIAILKLMLADVIEEIILRDGGGRRALFAHYQQRYKSNDADIEYFNGVKEVYISQMQSKRAGKISGRTDRLSDNNKIGVKDIKETFRLTVQELKKRQVSLDKADQIYYALEQMTSDNILMQDTNSLIEDL